MHRVWGVKCTQAGPGQGKLFGKDLAKAGSSQGGGGE